jgi:hypothetical protein
VSDGLLKRIGVTAGIIVAVWVLYLKFYAWPRDRLKSDLTKQLEANSSFQRELTKKAAILDGLKRFAGTTLSAAPDEADSRFRSGLGNIAVGAGLATGSVTVNTTAPEKMVNPAGTKVKTNLGHLLAKQTDFTVIRGELNGVGTLEEVLHTVAIVQNQPWVHRVERLAIKPDDKDRQRFSLQLGVATILMPDKTPKQTPEPRVVPLEPEAGVRWAGIVSKNMFREPPLQVARADPPAPPPAPPPPPTPPPWSDWRLTGVIETRKRVEALLVNPKNGSSAVLNVGSAVMGATFVGGTRDVALFEIDGHRYEVQIGQTLDQRSPSSR